MKTSCINLLHMKGLEIVTEYNFYFERSTNERIPLAQCDSLTDCWCVLHQFLKRNNYKAHYVRTWMNKGEMFFDVGSWTEFFIWTEPTKEES